MLDQVGEVDEFTNEFFDPNNTDEHPELSDFGYDNTGDYNYRPENRALQNDIAGADSRYIHTERYGWIDMKHFMTAAAVAANYRQKTGSGTIGYIFATLMGELVEFDQYLSDDEGMQRSAFSYEDLPSNDAGAAFGAYEYNPDKPLGPQIKDFLNAQNPTADPKQNVTNIGQLAPTESAVRSHHIHRNYTYKPFDLDKLKPKN